MNGLIKRMCILKQLKSGFSADGSPLSGVVRVERYGKLSTMQLSLINFAPLSSGRYICILCDKQGERLIFPLSSDLGEYKNDTSPFNPEKGFCALVCFVKNNALECVAAGQYGGGGYNIKLLTEGITMPEKKAQNAETAESVAPVQKEKEIIFVAPQKYDDEAISQSNYFEEEEENEQVNFSENIEDENAFTKIEKEEADGFDVAKNDEVEELFHPFKVADGKEYYLKIKDELEELFVAGERVDDLKAALPESEWVKVKDSDGCLVGVVYENLEVKYIAYALPAKEKTPPKEIKNACFIPVNPLSDENEGYFVLFQDVATGECVKVEQI